MLQSMKTNNYFIIKLNACKILIAIVFLLPTISIVQLHLEKKQLKVWILIQSRFKSDIDYLESRINDVED